MTILYERLIPFPNYNLITFKDLYRFWSKVNLVNKSENDCWEWTASILNGYGRFKLKSEKYCAHRVSWFLEFKLDPGKLLVCHDCNNTKCVNFNHLYLGNNSDNQRQSFKENRNPRCGEYHNGVILNDQKILEIIKLSKIMSQVEIAKKYGVIKQTINNIFKGRNWTHITGLSNARKTN